MGHHIIQKQLGETENREVVVEMTVEVKGRGKQKLLLRAEDFQQLVDAVKKVVPREEAGPPYGLPY